MRADHHDASERAEALQGLPDFDFAGQGPLAADRDEPENQQRADRRARRPMAQLGRTRIKVWQQWPRCSGHGSLDSILATPGPGGEDQVCGDGADSK